MLILAAGAPEIAHRRIIDRLVVAADGIDADRGGRTADPAGRSFGRLDRDRSRAAPAGPGRQTADCRRLRSAPAQQQDHRGDGDPDATDDAAAPAGRGGRRRRPTRTSATVEGTSPISVPARNAGTVTRDTPRSQSAAGV